MKIISHRGYWLNITEKNTPKAFKRSFQAGFGTETDLRDSLGTLVISHDMPTGSEQSVVNFLRSANEASSGEKKLTLALNIKSDGLADALSAELPKYPLLDCFVFDMSVPDMRQYIHLGIPVFSRMSEVEPSPAYLDRVAGVWLDSFESDWYDIKMIKDIVAAGKRVCIVSPELHGRDFISQWQKIRYFIDSDSVILCTDKPEDAKSYFSKENL
jgi:hypothetical protein